MKSIPAILLFLFLFSCNSSDQEAYEKKSDSDMDAARNFLEASLKGNYKEASGYMLQDSTNSGYLNVTERDYQGLAKDVKANLREASIRFYETVRPDDSTTITIYANSFMNNKDTLKIIRKDDKWLVDLKYLFEHDLDTTMYQKIINLPLTKDSTKKKETVPKKKKDPVPESPKHPNIDTTRQ